MGNLLNRLLDLRTTKREGGTNTKSDTLTNDELLYYGVPVSELDAIAKSCYHGVGVKVSGHYLWYIYKSNRGHETFRLQMDVSKNGVLVPLFGHNHFSVDQFLEKTAHITFTRDS
jgi:hypothetical protein